MRIRKLVPLLLIGGFFWWGGSAAVKVRAEVCDNPGSLTDPGVISGCISKYNGILEAIAKANATNKEQLESLQSQVTKLQGQIKSMDKQLVVLQKNIFDREVKVGVKRELLAAKVKQDYLRRRDESVMLLLFSADSAADFFRDATYRSKLAKLDKEIIESVVGEISSLNKQSTELATQKTKLAGVRDQVDKQADFLEAEVKKASNYEADLGGKISALTARQNELLAEKTGTFATSVGDVPLADDPASRPDYNPGFSPAFAMFSFGAPHFKGMSQYGAYGRAKAGQSVETILKAYYGDGIEIKKDYSTGINIRVNGYGTVDIETYVKRIYEVPSSWGDSGGMEALKAQAVAARSYALAYTNNGSGSICATEACQVYKPANKGGKWEEAVNATRGWVLVAGGKPFSAWYASTSGGHQTAYTSNGYTTPAFWDTTSNWTKWADGAWEKAGGSPWFYKGWYKSRSGKSCGRNHPWLNQGEFADIVNAAIVVDRGGDVSGIFPEDVRSCWGGSDNPWSKERLAAEADKNGGKVTSVSSVKVEHGNNGLTNRVILGTNRGEVSISGENFKKAFNLRAPGALALKSGLFNIEKK
jgi:peptidoglycan hydrolase CwlO-like protein